MLNVYYTTQECDLSFRPHLRPTVSNATPNKDLPLIMHSNGSICWEATDYLLDRHTSYQSISNSTIKTYARHLSKVVQFLDHHSIRFDDLTDNLLFDLRDSLTDSPNSIVNKQISPNQFNSILQRLFGLLIWLKNKRRIAKHVISEDPAIVANINVEKQGFTPKGSKTTRSFFNHPCRLPSENTKSRSAIRDEIIDILVEHIWDFTDNPFIHARWSCLLEALEQTGARDSEIATITLSSVREARAMLSAGKVAKLKITTTKGTNKGRSRLVPIAKQSVECFEQFIQYERSEVMHSAISKGKLSRDHGYLFVTQHGQPLSASTISSHFREVRKSANLDSHEAVPHMFRHRYISNMVDLYLNELLNNKHNIGYKLEEFVIRRVQQLTGHASSQSLFWYVEDSLERLQLFDSADARLKELDQKTSTLRAIQRELAKLKI